VRKLSTRPAKAAGAIEEAELSLWIETNPDTL